MLGSFRVKKISLAELFVFMIYFCCIVLNLLDFSMLAQVVDIIDINSGTEKWDLTQNMLSNFHPHAFRLVLMLPFYWIHDYFSIDVNISFGIAVLLLMFLTYKYIVFIVKFQDSTKFALLNFIFFVMLLMNGRIAFAIYGNALLLKTLYQMYYLRKIRFVEFIIKVFLGLFFTTVSTGTVFVGILSFIIFYSIVILRKIPTINLKVLFYFCSVIGFLIFLVQDFLLIYINKNLKYFGSFYNMASHGLGKYLKAEMILLVPIIIILIYFILRKIRQNELLVLPLSMVISASIIGVFGLSSLFSGLSGFILFITLYVKKDNIQQLYS